VALESSQVEWNFICRESMVNPLSDKSKLSESEQHLAALISKIAKGCESALSRLYDNTISLVYGLSLKILSDTLEAEEVALDVLKQVWNKAVDYNPGRGTPSAWLLTMTRSRAIDRLRSGTKRSRIEAPLEYDIPSQASSPEESASIGENRELIQNALSELTPQQRQSIELAYFYGYSQSEISDRLNQPLGTVKSWIRSGMMKLRGTLGSSEK